MVVVARFLPGFHAQQLRPLHNFVIALEVLAPPEVFKNGAHHHATGQPKNHAGRNIFLKGKEVELAAKLAVVAALGFFKLLEVGIQRLLVGKGRTVDARKHAIFFIAAPVGTGNAHELCRLGKARVRHVGATAQVCKITTSIERHRVGVDAFDELYLIRFAHGAKDLNGLGLGQHLAGKGLARIGNALHFRFDGGKIFAGKRLFDVKVVVKAGIDGGANSDLGSGEEALDRRSHNMGGRVTDHLQAFGRVGIHGRKLGAAFWQGCRKIQQRAVIGTSGHNGLELFTAQGFLQSRGNRITSLHRLPFHADFHEKLLTKLPEAHKTKWGGKPPHCAESGLRVA